MTAFLLPLALVLYIVGLFLAGLGTFYRLDTARNAAVWVYALAWLVHGATVIRRGMDAGRFPLTNRPEYLLLLGFVVMTLYLLALIVWRVHAAGLVLPPIAAAAGFGALAVSGRTAASVPPRPQGWFLFHTTVSTLSMAMLLVALSMSLIYLFQDRALKTRRRLKLLDRLPTLDRCDHIGFQALVVGFLLLTLGIVAGAIVNASVHGRIWTPGVKQTMPVVAWLIFATVLVARSRLGLRGRKLAYLTITGVMLGLATAAGMTF